MQPTSTTSSNRVIGPSFDTTASRKRSSVPQLRIERDPAGDEHAAPAADLAAFAVEGDGLGEDQGLGGLHDRAVGVELAGGDRADEGQMERGGQEEELFLDRVRGEPGGVIEGLEVGHAVRGAGGVEEVLADRDDDVTDAVADRDARLPVFIDGCGEIEVLELPPMFFSTHRGSAFQKNRAFARFATYV